MTTLEELAAHYAEVRKRLWMAQPKKAVVIPFPVAKQKEPEPTPPPPPTLDELIVKAKEKHGPFFKDGLGDIMKEVAKRHNVEINDMKGKSRKAKLVAPRAEFSCICVRQRKLSLTKVGQMLGGRDHTTILHAVRQYEKMLAAKNASAPNEGA